MNIPTRCETCWSSRPSSTKSYQWRSESALGSIEPEDFESQAQRFFTCREYPRHLRRGNGQQEQLRFMVSTVQVLSRRDGSRLMVLLDSCNDWTQGQSTTKTGQESTCDSRWTKNSWKKSLTLNAGKTLSTRSRNSLLTNARRPRTSCDFSSGWSSW